MKPKGRTLARPVQNGITFDQDDITNIMTDIDVLLQENRKFPPGEEFRAQAHIGSADIYEHAARDPEAYWAAETPALRVVRRRKAECRG
jgi:hypothetical protein